ncbi:uncharacterized protein J5F26_008232 isoform 1-T1 [Ciconia maguari]
MGFTSLSPRLVKSPGCTGTNHHPRLPVTTVQKDAETDGRWTIPIVTRRQCTKSVFPHLRYHKTPICPKEQREICSHLNRTHLKHLLQLSYPAPRSQVSGSNIAMKERLTIRKVNILDFTSRGMTKKIKVQ